MRRASGIPQLRIAVVPVLFAALLAGCSARRSEPITGALSLDSPELQRGRTVFMARCNQCHPGGDGGLGPSINDKPLPGFLVRLQVRAGLGAMPGFSEQDISEQELNDLVAYLKILRRHG